MGIGVEHIVLHIAVAVLFRTDGIEDGVLDNGSRKVELHAAGLALDARRGIEDLDLALKADLSGCRERDRCRLAVLQVNDLGPSRHAARERHGGFLPDGPCLRGDGEDLLVVALAVDGDGIGVAVEHACVHQQQHHGHHHEQHGDAAVQTVGLALLGFFLRLTDGLGILDTLAGQLLTVLLFS